MNIELYRSLFVNRTDVFAQQLESGAYMPVRRELDDNDIQEHLAGFWSIGTYVVQPPTDDNPEHLVTYLCFDLDIHDPATTNILCGLVEGLVSDRPSCLLREFSGNKGTHVWLFFDAPLPARQVRRWLDQDFWPEWTSATGGVPLEVFPKQDTVMEGGFGNLVKLPLGVHAVSGCRSEIQGYQDWPTSVEDVQPFPSTLVPTYNPAEGESRRRDGREHTGQPTSPFPCVDQILRDGAGKGQRNAALFHLALYCFGHALPEDLALELCHRANENFDPPLSDSEVSKTLDQAYTGKYHSARCGQDWLKTYCEGPCRGGGWTVQAQELEHGSLRRTEPGQAVEVHVVRKTTDGGRTRLTIGHPDARNEPTLICE